MTWRDDPVKMDRFLDDFKKLTALGYEMCVPSPEGDAVYFKTPTGEILPLWQCLEHLYPTPPRMDPTIATQPKEKPRGFGLQ